MPEAKKILGMSRPVAITVGIGGAIAAYMVVKHYANASAANTSAATASNTADTGAATDLDPATGYPYGSVQDESALAQQSGYAAGDAYGVGLTAEPYYNATPTTEAPTTNAAWSQYAEQTLSAIGYDPTTVAGAIGRYLAKLSLSADQANVVQVALAECGPPPQGAYSIIPQSTTTTTSNTGVTGKQVTGLHVVKVFPATKGNNGAVQIAWNPLSGAHGYRVYMEVKGAFDTNNTLANEGNLAPGSHSVMVTPLPDGKGTSVSFTVPK